MALFEHVGMRFYWFDVVNNNVTFHAVCTMLKKVELWLESAIFLMDIHTTNLLKYSLCSNDRINVAKMNELVF